MTRTIAIGVLTLVTAVSSAFAQTAPPGSSETLARIQMAGRIRFGYRVDARPFSFRDGFGNAAGYSIALCQRIADAVRTELGGRDLAVEWVPVAAPDRFRAVQQGNVDLLCAADTATLQRRSEAAFSIPIFPGGIGVMLRTDAPVRLRDVLNGRDQSFHPVWRASASQILQARAFGAISGTVSEKWLAQRIEELKVLSSVTPVSSYDAGVDALLARRIDALFGERAILLDAARRHAAARDLVVLNRLFTYGPVALTLRANDERFRLLVDRTLTRFYQTGELGRLYTMWFGEPDASAVAFFKWSTVPD